MRINKKIIIGLIFVLSIALLSNIAYAKPFTEAFGAVFIKINDFFDKGQYKAYSKTIDFFVFALVFIAIYMRGVKFAFKEITKTEKILAVILGLTTAFLMVIGDFSIVALLPFVNWLLYFLLFALMWWLLKDMKSKWARFFLALLLTLLLILIFLALFSGISINISCPESALPWLPWALAMLLFILFLFLLKNIKNAFGRILLALLLTAAVVLLTLFLLNTFSKDVGCPETPFRTTLIGDITDSFKRMDIGSAFGGFGGAVGPSVPTLQQVEPPDKKKEEEQQILAPQEQRPFRQTPEQELSRMLKDPNAATPTKQRIEEELRIRSQEQREKSAESLGLLFQVPRRQGITTEQYEQEILKEGEKRKQIGDREFYTEKKDDKIVIRENKRFRRDPVRDPNQDPALKSFIDEARKKQVPTPAVPAPPKPGEQLELEPAPPSTPGPKPRASTEGGEVTIAGSSGMAWGLGIALALLLFGIWKRKEIWNDNKNRFNRLLGRETKEKTIPDIIAKIDKVRDAKEGYITTLSELQQRRNQARSGIDVQAVFIEKIKTKEGQAFLFEHPKSFKKLEEEDNELIITERELVHTLRELAITELDFLKRFEAWHEILRSNNINTEEELGKLTNLISSDTGGIIRIIMRLFKIESSEIPLEQDLKILLKDKVKLITKRIDRFMKEEHRLSQLLGIDDIEISSLLEFLGLQITGMEKLKEKIQAGQNGVPLTLEEAASRLREKENRMIALRSELEKLLGKYQKYSEEKNDIEYSINLSAEISDSIKTALYLLNHPNEITEKARNQFNLSRQELYRNLWLDLSVEHLSFEAFLNQLLQQITEDEKSIETGINNIKRFHTRRKIVFGVAGATAASGIAGGLLLHEALKSTPPARLPPPPTLVEPAKERKLILLMMLSHTKHKIMQITYSISDTENPNAIYNVTVFLESPQGSGKYSKLQTYSGIKANIEDTKVFDARQFRAGKYNLIMGAITKDKPTIHSQYMELELK